MAVKSSTVRNLWLQWDQLVLDNGVLYRQWHDVKKKTLPCLQLVVPKSLQVTVRNSLHCNLIAGHLGVKKTTNKIKQKFYWYRLKDDVKLWICNCTVHGARKSNRRVNKSQTQNYQVDAPMDRVVTDILGPFTQSESSNRYVLLVGDYFTRWIEAYAIPEWPKNLSMSTSPDSTPHLTYIQIKVAIMSPNFLKKFVSFWKSIKHDRHPIIHSPMV